MSDFWADADLISVYTRAQAIEDGTLIDVSSVAKTAGIKYPVALTRAVWCQYVEVPEGVTAQDENGRLWDILQMFLYAARREGGSLLMFRLRVRNDNRYSKNPPLVTLKAVCGPGDTPEPCITIMCMDED